MVMTSNDGKSQIRNDPGLSSYFRGGYQAYGRYQWNVKHYGWEDMEQEIEAARLWAFGESVAFTTVVGGARYLCREHIEELIGRKVSCGFYGRSGGWFVVVDDLTEVELEKIDDHVKLTMESLPKFLREERRINAEFEQKAEEDEMARTAELLADTRIIKALELLYQAAPDDFKLIVRGIDVAKATLKAAGLS